MAPLLLSRAGLNRLAVVLFGLWVIFGQRVTFTASTGGRGVVSPFEILFVLVALLSGLQLLGTRGAVRHRGLWPATAGLLLFLMVVLPFWGVLVGNYGVRAMYSAMGALAPLAVVVTVRAAHRSGRLLDRVSFLAIVAHGAYGLGQMLARLGILPGPLWAWADRWDVRAQGAFSENYLIYGRSTGLFINANVFGLWSVLAATFAAARLRGWQRAVGVSLGLLGAFGSQSRTAWASAVLVVLLFAIAALTRPSIAGRAGAAAIWVAPALVVALILGLPQRLSDATAATRLESGLRVFSEGAAGDTNLLGRANAWSQAETFAREQFPLGTLGPPQVYFQSFIDNQYVSFYLQGTVLLVLAYVLALAAPLVFWRRRLPGAGTLGVMSACVALSSLTMLPVETPAAIALVWVVAAQAVCSADQVQGPDSYPMHVGDRRLAARGASRGGRGSGLLGDRGSVP